MCRTALLTARTSLRTLQTARRHASRCLRSSSPTYSRRCPRFAPPPRTPPAAPIPFPRSRVSCSYKCMLRVPSIVLARFPCRAQGGGGRCPVVSPLAAAAVRSLCCHTLARPRPSTVCSVSLRSELPRRRAPPRPQVCPPPRLPSPPTLPLPSDSGPPLAVAGETRPAGHPPAAASLC